jgi:hypothetical protein
MKTHSQSLLLSMVAATTGVGMLPVVFCPAVSQEQTVDTRPMGVRLIEGYKTWTKFNAEPVRMEPLPAWLCAAPMPNSSQQMSPHLQKYITVYVNDTGKAAMAQEKEPHFPVGSVIVKEKLSKPDSKSPELMTVMVKKEKGYNPGSGDWDYLVLDGTGKKVTAQGKLEKCQSCHQDAASNDYVFRGYYLSKQRRSVLRKVMEGLKGLNGGE